MSTNAEAIKKYQCVGCLHGSDLDCGKFKPADAGVGCGAHRPATFFMPNVGRIFLGMPIGFCRHGYEYKDVDPMPLYIYESKAQLDGGLPEPRIDKNQKEWYSLFNYPVWKHRTEEGHILVRGLHPRINRPFLHILLNDKDFDKINCAEISAQLISEMD